MYNDYNGIGFWIYLFFFVIIAIGGLLFSYTKCHSKAQMQGYECQWGPIQGCMVKVDGKWVDYDKWRVME